MLRTRKFNIKNTKFDVKWKIMMDEVMRDAIYEIFIR